MRWSKAFIPTLRDKPADAESAAEQLLVRAAFVRQVARGRYALLPLGQRTMMKIAAVVRGEMNAAGAQEFRLPGTAHDALFAELAAREVRSYKDLPQVWYTVQPRVAEDETAPAAGLLRLRELTVAGSYSLDTDVEGLDRNRQVQYETCVRIFSRCGLTCISVKAGDSLRFLVRTPAGEAAVVSCACGYTADPALACSRVPPIDDAAGNGDVREVHTPGQKTISEVSRFLGVPPSQQIKTLVYIADDRAVVSLVRGDHQLSEAKGLAAANSSGARPALAEEMHAIFGAQAGSLGPIGLTAVPVFCDVELRGRRNMICGANRDDYHLTGVAPGVHFEPVWADLRLVAPGEGCVQCGLPLEMHPAAEVGQIAGLSHNQGSDGPQVLTADGRQAPIRMGACQIALETLMAAAVELHHDDDGMIWPPEIAPFSVIVTPVTQKGDIKDAGERIYSQLTGAGYDTLLDDRPERPGVKFKDADLIGVPLRVVLGGERLKLGKVELFERAKKQTTLVALEELLPTVRECLKSLS